MVKAGNFEKPPKAFEKRTLKPLKKHPKIRVGFLKFDERRKETNGGKAHYLVPFNC